MYEWIHWKTSTYSYKIKVTTIHLYYLKSLTFTFTNIFIEKNNYENIKKKPNILCFWKMNKSKISVSNHFIFRCVILKTCLSTFICFSTLFLSFIIDCLDRINQVKSLLTTVNKYMYSLNGGVWTWTVGVRGPSPRADLADTWESYNYKFHKASPMTLYIYSR